jgi:hypothetical protein
MSQQITTQNLPDSATFLTQIINYITSDDNLPITSRQHIEKEQTFLNLLEANALSGRFTFEDMLEIAMRTKCYTVARFILEKLKRYENIVECFVLSSSSHELFRYIMEYKNVDERKIFQQVLCHFQSLLEMNCEKISKFVVEFYPICIPQFLQNVMEIPKLHYVFLQALISIGTINLDISEHDKYLSLMLNYNPENILEFLQNQNHTYDVEKALALCEEKNLSNAMIYLFERKGDHKRAFRLAMDLLKESPESVAETQALKVCSLCVRISNGLNDVEREAYWFELIEAVLSRNYLSSIVKQVLHLSSSYVDLTKLVQLIMRNDGQASAKNFGDIRHILIGMLTNFEYESLLLKTTQNIFGKDLHNSLLKEKQSAEAGIYCKFLKCFLCKRKLSDLVINSSASSDASESDQILIFSTCGHSIHQSCYQKSLKDNNDAETGVRLTEQDDEIIDKNLNSIKCNECGVIIRETDSIYLNKTNWKLISNDDGGATIELKLKAPTRVGLS